MATKTGSEVIAYCSACKMDLAAVVVAMEGDTIKKVQCKTCKKERAYKAPKGVTDPNAAPPAKKGSTKKTAAEKAEEARNAQAKTIAAEWQTIMESAAKKSKRVKYSPKSALTVGDIVEHPSFGDGVVMKLLYPNKAEIIFKTDIKIMMHSLGR